MLHLSFQSPSGGILVTAACSESIMMIMITFLVFLFLYYFLIIRLQLKQSRSQRSKANRIWYEYAAKFKSCPPFNIHMLYIFMKVKLCLCLSAIWLMFDQVFWGALIMPYKGKMIIFPHTRALFSSLSILIGFGQLIIEIWSKKTSSSRWLDLSRGDFFALENSSKRIERFLMKGARVIWLVCPSIK